MLIQLNKSEFEIASGLIKDGFSSAKETLQQILQTPIAIQRIEHDDYAIKRMTLESKDLYVLRTELKGEIEGSCYLLYTSSDVEKILASCLPDVGINSDPAIAQEFLKEMDNMVAGSMVTQFANYLGIFMYGDVPQLLTIAPNGIESYLHNEAMLFDSVMHYKAILNGPAMSIAPHFVWMFNSTLLDRIKESLNQ